MRAARGLPPAGCRRHQRQTRSLVEIRRDRIGRPATNPRQVFGQCPGRRVALARFASHRLMNDRFQVEWYRPVQLPQPGRRLLASPEGSGGSGLARRTRDAGTKARTKSGPAHRCRTGRRHRPGTARGPYSRSVPITSPVFVMSSPPTPLASPKSVTQTFPRSSRSRFAGLMSRWRIPCRWAYSMPSATCTPIRATR